MLRHFYSGVPFDKLRASLNEKFRNGFLKKERRVVKDLRSLEKDRMSRMSFPVFCSNRRVGGTGEDAGYTRRFALSHNQSLGEITLTVLVGASDDLQERGSAFQNTTEERSEVLLSVFMSDFIA